MRYSEQLISDFIIYLFEISIPATIRLSFSVFTDSVVHGAHVVPGLALEVHPVVSVLSTERQTVLVVHVVWFPLVPGGEVPGVAASPLPDSLSCKG